MLHDNPLAPLFYGLDVDNRLVLPTSATVLFLITSSDVIHSWTVPTLGIKTDAIPGRLNYLSTSVPFSGLYYGQCSEICGANHSFMPIVLEFVPVVNFVDFIESQLTSPLILESEERVTNTAGTPGTSGETVVQPELPSPKPSPTTVPDGLLYSGSEYHWSGSGNFTGFREHLPVGVVLPAAPIVQWPVLPSWAEATVTPEAPLPGTSRSQSCDSSAPTKEK